MLASASAVGALVLPMLNLAGTARSVDRSQLTIATVTRGTFTREVAADGQVVAAASPTLYATATGTVTLEFTREMLYAREKHWPCSTAPL